MSPSQLTRLLALNSEILKDGKYSDMTIKCGESVFKLHKSIVCTQSKPLAAAFNGSFKESEDSTIILEDNEPEVVDAMVHFLYEQSLDLKETESNSLLLLTVKVYIIADKYDIPALKSAASTQYSAILPTAWNNPSPTSTLIPALNLIYTSLPRSDRALKDLTIALITTHIDSLLTNSDFNNLCEENGSLSLEVLKATREKAKAKSARRGRRLVVNTGLGDMGGRERERNWCRECGSQIQRDPRSACARDWLCFGCGVRDRLPDTDRLFTESWGQLG